MKRTITLIFAVLALAAAAKGGVKGDDVQYDRYFADQTLRLDVSVSGDGPACKVSIDTVRQWPGWYGRRAHLTSELYPETVECLVIETGTGDTIYTDVKSYNALSEEDAPETVYVPILVPKPRKACRLVANIYGFGPGGRRLCGSAETRLTNRQLATLATDSNAGRTPWRTLREARDPRRCVHLAIVAEGYTRDEAEKFYDRAARLDSALFAQRAFSDNAADFNVVAVMLESAQSGISVPSAGKRVDSALGARFDSFGLERLVTIADSRALFDAIAGTPAGQIIILANTDKYGGSGSYNEYAISAADIPGFEEVVIHEFGHSFVWLGDEYDTGFEEMYSADAEPVEPNITTLHDFSGKWQNLIDSGEAGLVEGAGYQPKGVWRGCEHCLMRAIEDHDFCPVCTQAIDRVVKWHLGD